MKRAFTVLLLLLCGLGATWARELCDSTEVFFRQGRSVLVPGFDGNAGRLAAMDSLLADSSYIYTRVHVRGAASPEGPEWLNESLSRRRAMSAYDYFVGHGLPATLPAEFSYAGSDWRGLEHLVELDAAVPSRERVLALLADIIDGIERTGQDSPSNIVRLRTLAGGAPYAYMYTRFFPKLRKAGIFLDYEPRRRRPAARGRMAMAAQEAPVVLPLPSPAPSAAMVPAETPAPGRPFYMALKTNMLYDALAVPSLAAEFYVGRNWSVGAGWMYGWWDSARRHRYWRAYGGDVTLRRWFGRAAEAKPLTGHHLGIFAGAFIFDFEWGGKGYMGGRPGHTLWDRCMHVAGVEYGYSMPVARRLNIDFSIGIGYIGGRYVEYEPSCGCYMWQATKRLHWFGPAKAEVSLVWLIGRGNTNKGR